MQAIGIEDKRSLWEMRLGGGGHVDNIRADPTLVPRAQLGGGRSCGLAGLLRQVRRKGTGPRRWQEGEETLREP